MPIKVGKIPTQNFVKILKFEFLRNFGTIHYGHSYDSEHASIVNNKVVLYMIYISIASTCMTQILFKGSRSTNTVLFYILIKLSW